MKFRALDTETTLIEPRTSVTSRSRTADINTSPFVVPDLVLGTVADESGVRAIAASDFVTWAERALADPDTALVGHNLVFDLQVLMKMAPHLRPLIDQAAAEGRFHDTMVLDVLLRLALGEFDRATYRRDTKTWAPEEMLYRSLEDLARAYLHWELPKDPSIRLAFGQFLGRPLAEIPERLLAYARADAAATLAVFRAQERGLEALRAKNWLSEGIQIRAALACADLDARGVNIDRALAVKIRDRFQADLRPLEIALVAAGLGRWEPKKGTKTCQKVSISIDRAGSKIRSSAYSNTAVLPKGAVGNGPGPVIKRVMDLSDSEGILHAAIVWPSSCGPARSPQKSMSVIDVITPIVSIPAISGLAQLEKMLRIVSGKDVINIQPAVNTLDSKQVSGWVSGADGMIRRVKRFLHHAVIETAESRFHLNIHALQRALTPFLPADEEIPRRADGTLKTEAEWWSKWLPADAGSLQTWLIFEKLLKVLTTYLSVYSKTDQVFPRWKVLGARSGRMSCVRPNLQNLPKRKMGIRALFVPSPGTVFVKADYSAQEMYTLCETMLNMGIKGRLYEVLTSGQDIHYVGAGLVLGKPPSEVTKSERQAQKALHFGVPGGLGAKKLRQYAYSGYGVSWSLEEAKSVRSRFLATFTDIDEYLRRLQTPQDRALRVVSHMGRRQWAERLGIEDWNVIRAMERCADPAVRRVAEEASRQLTIVLPSGRQRGACRFTEGANTGFQGPASDVTKTALWNCYRSGLRVVMVVHDEIVVECAPNDVDNTKKMLYNAMTDAFRECCKQMGGFAGVEVTGPLERWGPVTDLKGKELTL